MKYDEENLAKLYKLFDQHPQSLAIRNGIVELERRLGIDDGLVAIDPILYLEILQASSPNRNSQPAIDIPDLSIVDKLRFWMRRLIIWLKR